MDKKTRGEFIDLFAEGFEGVVVPELEKLEQRFERVEKRLGTVENRLGTVENRMEAVERKLDRVLDNQLEDGVVTKDHEKRIKRLESTRVLA